MLLKTPLATDYSGVTISSVATPRAAVELIQTVTIADFPNNSVAANFFGPGTITIDAPVWANFARYKKIQFSMGPVGCNATTLINIQTRRNASNYTATKFFKLETITTASISLVTNGSSSTDVPLTVSNIDFTLSFLKQTDIFMTQFGGYAETTIGNQTTFIAGSISRTNFSIPNAADNLLPGYSESDQIGIQFSCGGNQFRQPNISNQPLRNFKLECNIYGWLR